MLKLTMIPDPSCTGLCRYKLDRSVTTAMFYTPIYDKTGTNVNHDKNTTLSTITCVTCARSWLTKQQGSTTTCQEIFERERTYR